MKVLRQFPEYEEFRTRTKQRKGQSGSAKDNGISREDLSPREAIEDVIDSATLPWRRTCWRGFSSSRPRTLNNWYSACW